MALISLITLILGTTPVLLRRPSGGWIDLHAHFMSWSYVGLVAAAAAESLTRLTEAPFSWAVVAASGVVIAVGAWLIHRSVPKILTDEFPQPDTLDPHRTRSPVGCVGQRPSITALGCGGEGI
jgi:hypothetical protein